MNGKENTQSLFLKYTAHESKKLLKKDEDNNISSWKQLQNDEEKNNL